MALSILIIRGFSRCCGPGGLVLQQKQCVWFSIPDERGLRYHLVVASCVPMDDADSNKYYQVPAVLLDVYFTT